MFAHVEIRIEPVIRGIGEMLGVAFGTGRGGVAACQGKQGGDEYGGLPDWVCSHGVLLSV